MTRQLFTTFLTSLYFFSAFGQEIQTCRYPINVTADSLVTSVLNDFKVRTGRTNTGISDTEWKKHFYDNTRGIKYDEAFKSCQDFLIQRLGMTVYCNYIDMYLNSFGISPYWLQLSFGLQLPNLYHKQRFGYIDCDFERVNIIFKMTIQSDSSLKITYPTNVPDCKGLPDCGFKVTKEDAISILKKSGFLTDSSNYYIEPDGINWVVKLVEYKGEVKTAKINLQTGEQSPIVVEQRID